MRPPAREGISALKIVLRESVPSDTEYFAAAAGDSPFEPGQLLVAGTALPRPVPAWYFPRLAAERPIPFDYHLLYADEELIVVDKPGFLPASTNGRLVKETVQTRLRRSFGEDEITPLHRLDRLTRGVLLFSRNPDSRGSYQQLFARRSVRKTYHALVTHPGRFDFTWQLLELPLLKLPGCRAVQVPKDYSDPRTKRSLTRVRLRHSSPGYHLLEIAPITGYTHQIRAVLNHVGAPIVGDDTYPVDRGLDLWDFSTPLQLRATEVSFHDPLSGDVRFFVSVRGLGETTMDPLS